ncbi:MAG: BON domain-containing protein [Alphaproteobacteria bacterium]|nr:BON domain-containing protein [Alphaproteobacteria bacterium]
MKNSLLFTVSVCALGVFALQGCTAVGVATGVGATAGVAMVQEGGISRAAKDAVIQAKINELWFSYNVEMFTKLDMTINNGRVLLTGVVQNPEHRVEAVRLAWQPEGVKQVINEITVADSNGITGYARDAWINGRLRTALMFDKNVLSVNYSIDTVRRVVYLMGYAQDQAELNRVIEIARTMRDVEQVVSYVKLVGQPDDPAPENNTISSQQYAQPPSNYQQDSNSDRIDWGEARDDAVMQDVPGRDPVVIIPQPMGYPNVDGRSPVLTQPAQASPRNGSTTDVIQSEDLLWDDKQ